MKIIKMHNAGNDYIFTFDNFNKNQIAKMCDRNIGIGGDGVVKIYQRRDGIYGYKMYNRDGSEGAFCGNATFCVAKLLYDKKLVLGSKIKIYTKSGIKRAVVQKHKKVAYVFVNAKKPTFFTTQNGKQNSIEIESVFCSMGAKSIELEMCLVSVGNNHAVVFTDITDMQTLEKIAKEINLKVSGVFSDGVNVQFVNYKNGIAHTTVYERGSGFTCACASGAAAVFAVINGINGNVNALNVKFCKGTIKTFASNGDIIISGRPKYCFFAEFKG